MFTIFIVGCASAYAEKWSQAQIRQIEEIAQEIARQTNANKSNLIDNVTAGVNATAKGRSVTFEYLVRTKRDLPGSEIQEWIAAARAETIPNICRLNSNNPAFHRGLSYIYTYKSIHGTNLASIFVDKPLCDRLGY